MPVEISGQVYYRTVEVYQIAGICKSTLLQEICQLEEYRSKMKVIEEAR
jgi:hypothetical protein